MLTWGEHGAELGNFDLPAGITIDVFDNVYVADRGNHRIQRFDVDGLTVYFPFPTIYPEQYAYMKALKQSLDSRSGKLWKPHWGVRRMCPMPTHRRPTDSLMCYRLLFFSLSFLLFSFRFRLGVDAAWLTSDVL